MTREIKIYRFMEGLWLFASLLSAGLCAYFIITRDLDSALYFLALFLISGLFFVLRRTQRKKKEKAMQKKNSQKLHPTPHR